jgi:hypothetical protein
MESRKNIARHLGVSLRTLQRYPGQRQRTPRHLSDAVVREPLGAPRTGLNEAQHARAWIASLERECEGLRGVIRALDNAQGQAAANSAVFNAF